MMNRFFKQLTIATAAITIMAAPAAADAKSEQFVELNANEVLAALNNPNLDSAGRTQSFNKYMDEFANINAVARIALGKYARRFNDKELDVYRAAFREYALAVYEAQLDQYRGEEIEVLGSDDNNSRDSIVKSRVTKSDGESLDVYWRVFLRPSGYQVVDVALKLDGNVIWLGSQQRRQFVDLLNQNRGSSEVLIDWLNNSTAKLREAKAAGTTLPINYDEKDAVGEG